MKKLIFLFLLLRSCYSFSQTIVLANQMPKLIPASPSVAAINRFGDYTVNLFHGLTQISIPIYEIKVGGISVPIGISYHASGVKVNDWGNWVGTGWALLAGGNISRKVNGKPDEVTAGYFGNYVQFSGSIDPFDYYDYYWLEQLDKGWYDVEADIFSYNLPNRSGKFVFNVKDNLKPVLLPKEPIKVDFVTESGSYVFFKITTEDGTVYIFKDQETTMTSQDVNTHYTSAWQLTTIISPSTKDTIKFIYADRYGPTQRDVYDMISVDDDVVPSYDNQFLIYQEQLPTQSSTYPEIYNNEKVLSEIIFPGGKVVFEQSQDNRLDVYYIQKKLAAIKVYKSTNGVYELLRTASLGHSYFMRPNEPDTRRIRLDEVQFKDNSGAIVEKYALEYNTGVSLPERLSRSKDFWGYFNNVSNASLVPRMEVPFIGYLGSTNNVLVGSTNFNAREVEPLYSQACMLSKITYPTGGYTEFEFESNKHLDNGHEKLAGGHRIQKISSYAYPGATPTVKTYKYGVNESGYGRANFNLNYYYFKSEKNYDFYNVNGYSFGCSQLQRKRNRVFYSMPSLALEPFDGSPVTYGEVTEYDGDASGANGKTVYKFTDQADEIIYTTIPGKHLWSSRHLLRGQLAEKSVFAKVGNNYSIIEKTENRYNAFGEDSYVDLALVWSKNKVYDIVTGLGLGLQFNYNVYPDFNDECFLDRKHAYGFENYPINTVDQKLVESKTTSFDLVNPAKRIIRTQTFQYSDQKYLQPVITEFTNSKGEMIKTENKFPFSFANNSLFAEMVNRNMVSAPVESRQVNITLANKELSKIETQFALFNNSQHIKPIALKGSLLGGALETETSFNSYNDHGNVIQLTDKTGLIKAYVWDYREQYPIAEVTGATIADVAYTSFEAEAKGGWTFSGSPLPNQHPPTGKKAYSLSNGPISKSGLNAGKTYVVCYWSKDGPQNITNGSLVYTGITSNGWTYYEHNFQSTAITLSGSGVIDEVRLYPKGAFMTTYTYEPLVGMISQTDPNGRNTYYEYDAFNRLLLVRDQDNKVLKKYEYKYAGQ